LKTNPTTLRLATDADIPMILRWRNHPEVRRVMFTDHEICEVEHLAWWARVRDDPAYRLLVIEHRGAACGVVTFARIANADACWLWGFYLNPEAFTDGSERLRAWNGMELASIEWARSALACAELRCEVFAFNTAVLQMHLRHRFAETARYTRVRADEQLDVVQLARKL
jgi:UDP-4-amino-4,6-dideoxy-N-acetyl-beta-L-altrosamine N-acetyltransferase